MKGFIEVVPRYYKAGGRFTAGEYVNHNYMKCININHIVSFENNLITTVEDSYKVKESYEEIKELIKQAQL